MLATLVAEPFDDPEWLFEIKWDGYRALCTIEEQKLSLISRNGLDMLRRFPALEALAGAFASVPVVVDGEIVSLDSKGRSTFQRLQESQKKPAGLTYAAFDLLYADGTDLRSAPLEERKALLERLIRDDSLVLYSKHVVGKGKALFASARKQHLEGIIGKKRDSTYQERRSRDWVKIKTGYEQEFVVGGWTEPKGSRKGFGALLLGVYRQGSLIFVGSVGTGFNTKMLAQLSARLRSAQRKTSPFVNDVVANSGIHWVSPEIVVQVRFSEWTRDGYLRQPTYLGLRPDKPAREVVAEIPVDA
jgi:bifunctional non-homologous end joining protein LigD